MNILYPKIPLRRLPSLIRITVLSAIFAGGYGALHDQVSYTISAEYFTRMKFLQFEYLDFGWPPRVLAAEVGFLATWWVGLIGGWFIARAGLAELTERSAWYYTPRTFALAAGVAIITGALGTLLGAVQAHGDLSGWRSWQEGLDLRDLPAFVIVAYLHWASYLGGVLGLVAAGVYVKLVLAHFNSSAGVPLSPAEAAPDANKKATTVVEPNTYLI